VVVTNGWTGDQMLRASTHNLTLSAIDWWSGLKREDRQRRYLTQMAIYGVPPDVMDQLQADQPKALAEFGDNVAHNWIGGPAMDVLSERRVELVYYDRGQYEALYTVPLHDLLRRYRTDYIWVGPWEREVGRRDFDRSPELTPVFKNLLIQIYQVNQEAGEAQADRRHTQQ
jgi:hypothetical protein